MDDTGEPAAYREILKRILSGEFRPGARLSEPNLAADLSISRTPIREALVKLRNDGFITSDRSRATIVSHIDRDLIVDSLQLRRLVEPDIAARAAELHSERDDFSLSVNLASHRAALETADARLIHQCDHEFHAILGAIARRPVSSRAVQLAKFHLERFRRVLAKDQEYATRAVLEHEDIVAAVQQGDRRRAGDAMLAHVTAIEQACLALLE